MANRLERLSNLEKAVKEYVKKEKARIDSEVSVLEAVLEGRTGGAGASISKTKIAAVALNDLSEFLRS